MPRASSYACLLALVLGSGPLAHAATADARAPLFNADGYRITLYRSPTPERIDGAQIVGTEQLQALLGQHPKPVLIDVYRRQWLEGRFIEDEPHANLPGSHWLANTGDGELAPRWMEYFTFNLRTLTDGRQDTPLVFYCRADCWLSWNATKRASALGYSHLYWYRDGLDAWLAAGLPVEPAQPEPLR
ncbi:PQQ-dependent catabolism-associated CXXCW motif protein [Pseudomonas abietaniphila]|uniref:PQQ-dependent catabolism-associated CXXCW motif protein n=1 Tax=Pseudomonas abietaniphila TaxID=89065 RepID=UPI00078614CF|nr:PQQ-dependent catabolism-associated CXXCW motif protein [Pseudomonas abietaniphila]